MRQRNFRYRLQVGAVLVAGVLVALYAAWVIRDASGPPPGESTRTGPTSSRALAPSATPTAPPPLAPFRKAASKARTLLVIGDSTGAGPGDWVDLVAQDLGARRAVTLHQWDEVAGDFSSTPTVYGAGKPLTIWNLSYPGVKGDYPQRLSKVPDEPGAVILNIGHDRSRKALDRTVRATAAAVDKRWGSVLSAWVLQNPSTGDAAKEQEAAVDHLTDLATAAQVPVIDVHAAFRESGRLETLLLDGTRPNADGSRLWADVVGRALGR